MVTSFTCLRKRVLEKNTRVVLRKLKRWMRTGMARAARAHRKEGYKNVIETKLRKKLFAHGPLL